MKSGIKIILETNKPSEDEVYSICSVRRSVESDYIYDRERIDIQVGKDGSIYFSDDNVEHFIYFYPDQLKHLLDAVNIAIKQSRKKNNKIKVASNSRASGAQQKGEEE